MELRGSVLEWFIAAGAFVTAAATTATGFLVWRQHRWQKWKYDPIVECQANWVDDGTIGARITVRNRMPQTIDIVSIDVVRPRGSSLSTRMIFNPADGSSKRETPVKGPITIGRELKPSGGNISIPDQRKYHFNQRGRRAAKEFCQGTIAVFRVVAQQGAEAMGDHSYCFGRIGAETRGLAAETRNPAGRRGLEQIGSFPIGYASSSSFFGVLSVRRRRTIAIPPPATSSAKATTVAGIG